MHNAVSKGWLTAGPINNEFERALGAFTGHSYVHTCNSGSSANLLAVASLVEAGYWKPGDEVITAACAFPTTVNPLLLYGLVPVFVDVEIGTYNVSQKTLDKALGPKTRGVMLAHTLGNPYDLAVPDDIHLIEDCCDALGSRVVSPGNSIHVGHRGRIATCSFFPAHHITTGEGGAVFTNDRDLASLSESIRDWGRDCYCEPGKENTCGKRFEHEWESLPKGYDHKYTYSRLGFNLKLTECQAACGLAQLGRVQDFIRQRKYNFSYLQERLRSISDQIYCPAFSDEASPFGFPITLKEEGQRTLLQEYLKQEGIDSRLIFSGNLTRQPYMKGRNFRISGTLENSDKIMRDSLWIGCHPSLTEEQLEYMAITVGKFFGRF
jgi:CDP-6-deoxy-D-xylo-4-hexulose-3-dehydrase